MAQHETFHRSSQIGADFRRKKQELANSIDTVAVDSLNALDLNDRLELFDHLAVSRQLELEHGTFGYVR